MLHVLARVAAVTVCAIAPAMAQDVSITAVSKDDLPTVAHDTPSHRAVAQALAQHLCADVSTRPRILPYTQSLEPDVMPRLPDIAPGILGSFMLEVANKCSAVSPEQATSVVEWMGLREDASKPDSVSLLWQVTSPIVNSFWSVEVRRGVAVCTNGAWAVTAVVPLRRNLYRVDSPATVPPVNELR